LTPGDLDELTHHYRGFWLEPSFLPDLAGSLDGHIPDEFTPTTIGGIGVEEVATMGLRGLGRLQLVSKCGRAAVSDGEKKPVFPTVSSSVFAGWSPNERLHHVPQWK